MANPLFATNASADPESEQEQKSARRAGPRLLYLLLPIAMGIAIVVGLGTNPRGQGPIEVCTHILQGDERLACYDAHAGYVPQPAKCAIAPWASKG